MGIRRRDRIAPPGLSPVGWNAWLASLRTLPIAHPWPFPVTVDRGETFRNLMPEAPARRSSLRAKSEPGATVKLRAETGDMPTPGTELVTPSGRRYQVTGSRGKTLTCIVLAAGAPAGDPVWQWTWTARDKRVEP